MEKDRSYEAQREALPRCYEEVAERHGVEPQKVAEMMEAHDRADTGEVEVRLFKVARRVKVKEARIGELGET